MRPRPMSATTLTPYILREYDSACKNGFNRYLYTSPLAPDGTKLGRQRVDMSGPSLSDVIRHLFVHAAGPSHEVAVHIFLWWACRPSRHTIASGFLVAMVIIYWDGRNKRCGNCTERSRLEYQQVDVGSNDLAL